MDDWQKSAGELVPGDNLDESVLTTPHVPDEGTFALGRILWEAICLGARESLDLRLIVVSDKGSEATLVGGASESIESKVLAVGILATLVSALIPVLEKLKCLLVVLNDDETGVEVELAKLVLVMGKVGVPGESEGVLGRINLPVVHQPLQG